MASIIPNEGEVQLLKLFANKAAAENLKLCLFTSNTTLSETTTLADLTEATGAGYAAIDLVSADWTVTAGAPSTAVCLQKVFAFTGALGASVYGYYLLGATSGKIYCAEKFADGPYAINNNGDEIKVLVTYTIE